jgi:type I restriction enzyme R subunit
MREIIDHIDALRFRSQAEKHELSHLYEAKIKNMGNAGRNGGEYYTPRPLIRAIVQVVQPTIGKRIYDGAVGSAGFLCEAYEYLKQTHPKRTTAQDRVLQERTFYGKEKKSLAYVIAIMNMILHGIEAPNILHTKRVTANDGELGEQHLRDFQDNEKTIPTVLTTSQKLSTGVDARNIRNIVLMRSINSMIEFKQIIGRGTRLYDGKDYFTIYDFVKAHHHFSDPEWDGEPIEPEPKEPRYEVGPSSPPRLIREPEPDGSRRPKIKVKLADGKARTIQHMMCTTFWHPDGTPTSAQQFMEMLFGKLPEFFKDETELRALWSVPETRKKLLQGLAERGFGGEQLAEMQKIIDAEKSDLFDVLAHVAYALPPVTREERAAKAKVLISTHFNSKQQVFLDFVLSHYVSVGVGELDQDKLTPLLRLKYHNSIADAVADLGRAEDIGRVFAGFQKYLYQQQAVA